MDYYSFLRFFIFMCVYMNLCSPWTSYRYLWKQEEGVESQEAEVIGCKLSVGAEYKVWVLYKSNQCS